MKKVKFIMATMFLAMLSTSFIHAAVITIPHNSEYYISYGYSRAIDNEANTLYQTLGECYQSNAAVTVYLKNSSGVSVKSATAYRGKPVTVTWKVSTRTSHSHAAASSLIQ